MVRFGAGLGAGCWWACGSLALVGQSGRILASWRWWYWGEAALVVSVGCGRFGLGARQLVGHPASASSVGLRAYRHLGPTVRYRSRGIGAHSLWLIGLTHSLSALSWTRHAWAQLVLGIIAVSAHWAHRDLGALVSG